MLLRVVNLDLFNQIDLSCTKDAEHLTYGSGRKVRWICTKDKNHTWVTTVHNRFHGSNCPRCYEADRTKKRKFDDDDVQAEMERRRTTGLGLPIETNDNSKKCTKCSALAVVGRPNCEKCATRGSLLNRHRADTLKGMCANLTDAMKHRSKTRHAKRGNFFGTCTWTPDQLERLYEAQLRRCAISGLPISHRRGSHFQMSPNRKDDATDYDDNTEIVALEFNTAAKWTTAKLQEFREARAELLSDDRRQKFLSSVHTAPPRGSRRKAETNARGKQRCWICNSFQAKRAMKNNTECKQCTNKRKKKTIRAELQTLLSSARGHTKLRSKRKRKLDLDIDLEFLCDLLVAQDFRCAYSRVVLHFPCFGRHDPCFRMSLERKNARFGYTRENVCLVARGFQSADNAIQIIRQFSGSAAWSRAKFQYVMTWLDDRDQGHTSPRTRYEEFLQTQM